MSVGFRGNSPARSEVAPTFPLADAAAPPPRPAKNRKSQTQQELKRLDASGQAEGGTKARVFKLIGPALVAQDADEARATVSRRLAAIGSELERVGGLLGGLEAKAADKQRSLAALQQRMMAAQQQQQAQGSQGAQQQGGGQQAAAV